MRTPRESCRTFHANTRPQLPCASRNFPSSGTCWCHFCRCFFGPLCLQFQPSSEHRSPHPSPLPPQKFSPFRQSCVFHCRSNLQFFLSFLFLVSLFSLPENETRVWRRNLQISPAQKFRPLFVRQRKFVRRINVCTTCISCNAINPPLLNGVIN